MVSISRGRAPEVHPLRAISFLGAQAAKATHLRNERIRIKRGDKQSISEKTEGMSQKRRNKDRPGKGRTVLLSLPLAAGWSMYSNERVFFGYKNRKNNNKIWRKGERLMPIRMTFLTERERGRESKHTQTQPIGVITGGSVIAGAIAAFYLLFYLMETVCQKVRRGRKWIRERGEEKSSLSPKNEWKELEATRKVDSLAVTV